MACSVPVCVACASACHCVHMLMLHGIRENGAQRQLCFAEATVRHFHLLLVWGKALLRCMLCTHWTTGMRQAEHIIMVKSLVLILPVISASSAAQNVIQATEHREAKRHRKFESELISTSIGSVGVFCVTAEKHRSDRRACAYCRF